MLQLRLMASWTQQRCMAHPTHRHFCMTVVAMAKPWRPDMNDVDSLSRGDGAKRRGTGNFNIPHRLNSDERPVYEAAKKKGYLQVRGTGYRKSRRGNPLPNVYRQWCDAKATACIVIEQDTSGNSRDVVVVDLAPLRQMDLSAAVQLCSRLAEEAGARNISSSERPLEAVPFNTIPVDLPLTVEQMLLSGAAAAAAEPQHAKPSPEQLQAAEMAVLQQADVVRQLKASGLANSSPEVQKHVQELLKLKADLQQLLDASAGPGVAQHSTDSTSSGSDSSSIVDVGNGVQAHCETGPGHAAVQDVGVDLLCHVPSDNDSSSSSRRQQVLPEDHPFVNVAIWQLPVMPLFYEADRTTAKTLAKQLFTALAGARAARR